MSAIKPALLLCLILAIGLFLGQGRANPVEANVPNVPNVPDVPASAANELDIDFGEEDATEKPLGIVSIKVRHIQPDPAHCTQLSPHHPHHPQCHSYCKRQGHWVGQCKRNSCHCFS
ncbi:uncharacterized protein LOC6550403 [Drosophila erecta]|uniref:Invertebrate defensins family profile domain-containing protein n=1 Tax=Drosophila erecta TaxID=7220 RepID=B3NWF7_DROER|nr:uncharacterized protein LOC6550403 [Drosophila erecta]EDV46777.1 uncharacterized protein Dere_GG19270 [Drosophila erecta]